ncbi:hypothetical protein [Candidatus Binatus sp.]|uniref:hypothetical protein n=1 Tax=Candidatus Binatus sp. TaxID=2811406 RepID=UPI003CC5BFF0
MTPDNRNNDPLDPILRRAMRTQPGPATPECADAESLAAYSDRSLAATERERLETHFADCMRCQLMLADIARADESARAASAASEIPWYRRWRVAIPALAAAAAILVFIAIRRPANEESQRDELVAMAKNEAPHAESAEQEAPASPPQAAPPAPAPAAAASVLAMNEARNAIARREVRGMYLSKPAPATAPPAAPASPPAAAASAPAASASNVIAMNEAKTESAARGEAISAYSSQALHREEPAPGARAFSAMTGAAAPNAGALAYGSAFAPRSAAVGAGSGAVAGGGTALSLNETASSARMLVTISTPGGSVTWIAGKDGFVQRHDADGATRTQHSGVSTDLAAGSAPSATVCWIVGRSGTIIRTTDGEHWELITAPTAENLAAVSASSAKDAMITTTGGQSFATSDGGASWHRQ